MGHRMDCHTDPEFGGKHLVGLKQVAEALQETIDGMIGGSVQGLADAGIFILSESAPRAPVDMGDLRGSGYVEMAGQTIARSESSGGVVASGGIPKDAAAVIVGFSAPYAAIQHEQVFDNHPHSGEAKYLESVLEEKQDDVLRRIFEGAQQGMTGGGGDD